MSNLQLECNYHYAFHVNLDERGIFKADVRNAAGDSVYEISNDADDGSLWLIENGFMRNIGDLKGLTDYLVQMEVLPKGSTVHTPAEFEGIESEWYEALDVLQSEDQSATIESLYDDNEDVADALQVLIRNFEYPDFSGKTLGQVVKQITGEPSPTATMKLIPG